ncbi:hypothetical protein PanWU01x14_193380 [Parasponia andersonii]|uniref:Uncharacterized protein n=1 Tax=Parasponia andersonii TaxID=3476 RepID=A0A2P5C136_PARAD|nr:hypothetical protein PanWU01x14_193380 [Parasponia andersonii]
MGYFEVIDWADSVPMNDEEADSWAGPGRASLRAQNVKPSPAMGIKPDWTRAYLYWAGLARPAGYLTGPRASPLDPAHFDRPVSMSKY